MNLEFDCQHTYPAGFTMELSFQTEHQCTVLLGPSGSGKTSVLAMIAGTMQPNAGRITIDDQVVFDSQEGICVPPQHRGVGYVFQQTHLFPHMSVLDNLRFGRRWRSPQNTAIDFDRMVEMLEIQNLLERRPANLSGGEKQRVAMGRALASGPRLLLMDEPVAHVDLELRLKIVRYLQELLEEWEVPVIYVTHSPQEASSFSGQILKIRDGRMDSELAPKMLP
ncbi:MAG: ATP-binding cassette domain-containing protein [Pirellulaceae bacterium]|nr:ATP-binding cassette domain-containing protein [Pirellulaceae bacterium]